MTANHQHEGNRTASANTRLANDLPSHCTQPGLEKLTEVSGKLIVNDCASAGMAPLAACMNAGAVLRATEFDAQNPLSAAERT
jgi:hypothetical protein